MQKETVERSIPIKKRGIDNTNKKEEPIRENIPVFPISSYKKEGLSDAEAVHFRELYGANTLTRGKRTSFFRKFLSGFGDPIIRILLAALAVNFIFLSKTFDVFETCGILFAVLAATLISALSEQGGEKAFDRLQAEADKTFCLCLRSGSPVSVPIDSLVSGDTVLLSAGERIPADGILLEGSLCVTLAALNGEAEEQKREAVPPFSPALWDPADRRLLFRGAAVTRGDGKMLVLRTGDRTLFGGLTRELQTETRESPLRARLSILAAQMSRVGYLAALAVALVCLFNAFFLDAGCSLAGMKALLSDRLFVSDTLIHALMLAVTTVVVAVPEGLPMMISVVLSSNIRRMQRDRVLVRKPVGIETAGSLNVLFCDKTGTLTRGEPVVAGILTSDCRTHLSYGALRAFSPVLARHYLLSARCNTQSLCARKDGKLRAMGGNATDRAILESVLSEPSPEDLPVTERIPFDSQRKYSSARVGGVRYIKGAPEVVLDGVVSALDAHGNKIPLDRTSLDRSIGEVTTRAGRVLALCAEIAGERCFVLAVCIRDGLRPGARAAVRSLSDAGIRVVMITGDGEETACAIARESGILTPGGTVLSSEALSRMDDRAVTKLLPRLSVLYRALPGDKSRLVRLSQAAGLTVGMTGDGVNDAPALRAADVGFAMGSGTGVAQEAGDIVILDDNIASIARAVLYGRTIFKSIRKFIMFQMTTNLSAVGISVLCPFVGLDSPITVLQMLWINMIMDTLGSLAFAGEAPAPSAMREKPKKRGEPIMNRYMVCRIAAMGAYLLGLCLWFAKSETMRAAFGFSHTPVRFLGAFFALFIFADISNSVSARTTHPFPFHRISRNPSFVVIFSLIIAAQLFMIYFGGTVFRTVPLSLHELLWILLLSSTVLLFSVFVKLFLSVRFHGETV